MNSTDIEPCVYLAGPGVFRPDPIAFGEMLKEKCARAGLEARFPMDNEIAGNTPEEKARSIYRANVSLIDGAQAILADISPFRGPNMDPGTAWEIGYGIAKKIPVFAWTDDYSQLTDRTLRAEGRLGQVPIDRHGWSIENFQHVENLMITQSVISIHKNEDDAIAACAAHFREGGA